MRSFALAPMSAVFWILTVPLLGIPILFLAIGLRSSGFMLVVGSLLVVLYLAVWLWWRPGSFEVEAGRVRMVFPLRSRMVEGITGAKVVTVRELRERVGLGFRVGVGGLWGQFGWLWTTKAGMMGTYISSTRGLVLLERDARPVLLITPVNPDELVAEVTHRQQVLVAQSGAESGP